MWTDWDHVSRRLIDLVCDYRLSTPAECARMTRQIEHTEQLEQWVLAFLTGIAFVMLWVLWDWAWSKLRPLSHDEPPATPADLFPLLRKDRRHGH